MKLLVTGGCGFLGSNLAAYAMAQGVDTVVFDNLSRFGSSENLRWLQKQGAPVFIHGDIRNMHDVEAAVKGIMPDAIFHLAGQVAMTTSLRNPRLDFEINATGSLNILESVRNHAPHCSIIYSSTNKVYGDLINVACEERATRYVLPGFPGGLPETVPFNPHSPYGVSKGAADTYMLDYHRMFGIKTVVFRHSSMYGGRQYATHDQGWITWFCRQALLAKKGCLQSPFTISGNGKQVRDVLHVDDMISLYFSAVERVDAVQGQCFNIGGGMENSLSLLELFSILESMLDTRLTYRCLAPRESDQRVFVADISKATEGLGWRPKTSKEEGIRQTLMWVETILQTS